MILQRSVGLPLPPPKIQAASFIALLFCLRRMREVSKPHDFVRILNIAALTVGCSTNVFAMQSPPAPEIFLLSEAVHPQSIAQNAENTFAVANISGASGQAIPLSISMADEAVTRRGLIMFQGMPAELELTSGFRAGDKWLISLAQRQDVKLIVPTDYQGAFDMNVVLVLGEGKARQSRKISVNIISKVTSKTVDDPVPSKTLNTAAVADEVSSARPPHATPPPPSTISPDTEKTMMDRGAQLIQTGDIGAARLIYEYVANNGSAAGALSLAKTYDPEVLAALEVAGMQPNPALAQRWYQRAAELGDVWAKDRLKAFASSGR